MLNVGNSISSVRTRAARDMRFAYVLVLPLAIVLIFVDLWPIAWGFKLGFTYNYLLNPADTHFVGLANYIQIARDPMFWAALSKSLIYTITVVSLQFMVGFTLALCLNQDIKGKGLFRMLVLTPWVIPSAIAGLSWTWMYNGLVGVVNDLLSKAGLIRGFIPFLADPNWAMVALVFVTVWKGFPFMAIMLLAGLQALPKELYEAAEVDGANAWGRFIHITIPGLKYTILITLLLGLISTFNLIDLIYVMTKGGPGFATQTLPLYTYKTAFAQLQFGYGASLSIVILMCLLVGTYFYIRLLREGGEEF